MRAVRRGLSTPRRTTMKGNGSIDLAELDTKKGAEAGFQIELRHPKNNQPLGMWIRVLGADSDAYQEQLREFRRRSIEALKRDGRASFTAREAEDQTAEQLAAVTRGWSDNMKLDGEPLVFSESSARKLY